MSAGALFLAVFLACTVEAVEATTIVLAAGTARDWRSAGYGAVAAIAVLAVVVAALGPALTAIPTGALRLVIGALCRSSVCSGSARRCCGPEASRRSTTRTRSSTPGWRSLAGPPRAGSAR